MADEFKNIKSFEQLLEIIEKMQKVTGSDGTEYTAEYLIDTIDDFRESFLSKWENQAEISKNFSEITDTIAETIINDDKNLSTLKRCITRNGGLRKKVIELATQEVNEKIKGMTNTNKTSEDTIKAS